MFGKKVDVLLGGSDEVKGLVLALKVLLLGMDRGDKVQVEYLELEKVGLEVLSG